MEHKPDCVRVNAHQCTCDYASPTTPPQGDTREIVNFVLRVQARITRTPGGQE